MALTDGLKILASPVGYYRSVIMVGWLRAGDGLEVEIHGARVLTFPRQIMGMEELAARGPHGGIELRRAVAVEPIWRPNILRAIPANEAAWAEHCPRPASYDEGG